MLNYLVSSVSNYSECFLFSSKGGLEAVLTNMKILDYKISFTWRAICENIVSLRCFIIHSNPDISGHTCPGVLTKKQILDSVLFMNYNQY